MSTWARKPGQTLGQAQADAKQSSAYNYTPNRQAGQAQPQASPYGTATPYGQSAVNMQSYAGTSPYGQAPQAPTSRTDGNWANYASNQRPAPFTASYGNPFGGRAAQPDFSQRDAFIQSLNNQATPYMAGQQRGPIQYDFTAALANANQMVNNGFQNPFNFGQPPQPQAASPPQAPGPASQQSVIEQTLQRLQDARQAAELSDRRAPAPFVPSAPIGATARPELTPLPQALPAQGPRPDPSGRTDNRYFWDQGQSYENSNWINPLARTPQHRLPIGQARTQSPAAPSRPAGESASDRRRRLEQEAQAQFRSHYGYSVLPGSSALNDWRGRPGVRP